MVLSALQSTELALESGLRKDQIIISCKVSRPRDLIAVYRDLARKTDQPLHLGLTEAGMGIKGLVWSASAMGVLLNEGIGDTIRVSLTPRPGRRSPRRGLRRVRAPAGARPALVRAERHRVPRLRPHDEHDLPGAGRAHAGLHPRADAGVEDAVRGRRDADAGRHGLRRQRPRRIEGRQHRHQPARHRRSAELPGLHRRPARHDAARHLRRAGDGAFAAAGRRLRRDEVPAKKTARSLSSVFTRQASDFMRSAQRANSAATTRRAARRRR